MGKIDRWWRKTGKRFAKDRAFGTLETLATNIDWLREQTAEQGEKFDKLMVEKNGLVSSEATARSNLMEAERDLDSITAAYEEYRNRAGERLASIGLLSKNFGPSE